MSAPKLAPARPDPAPNKRVQRAIRTTGIVPGERKGLGTILTEPVLVVNQKAKLIEVNAEYAVFDQHGRRIGTVREVGQNLVKKALKADVWVTRRFQITDQDGQTVLSMLFPATALFTKVTVLDSRGVEVGQIAQKFGILNSHFALKVHGKTIGSINGEGWDSWDFNVCDSSGSEIARITKKWAGAFYELFTNKDNYVVEIHGTPEDSLRKLIVAAALVIDTGLRQGQSKEAARAARKPSTNWGDGSW